MGVTWAWLERSQGWNLMFLTWQWLESIVIHWNEECWNFGEAYGLMLVELTWKSAFLKGFCSLPTSEFLIYFKNVHIYVNVWILYVWDIILSGTIMVIIILTHLPLIEILVRDRLAILTPIYVKEKNENSKYLSSNKYRYIFISFLQLINDIYTKICSIMLICKGRHRKVN